MGIGGGGFGGGGAGGGRRGEAAERAIDLVGGDDDGVDVVDLGFGGGAFDVDELEGTELGEDVDEAGEGVGADAGVLAVGVPVVLLGDGGDLAGELLEVGVVDVGGLVAAVEEGDGVGDAGDEAVDGEAIIASVVGAFRGSALYQYPDSFPVWGSRLSHVATVSSRVYGRSGAIHHGPKPATASLDHS